jgi:hypothetical protein
MRNVLYQDRLKSERAELSRLHSAYEADPDDVDTIVAVFIVAQQLVQLFKGNQALREAVKDDYPILLDADEAAEHPDDTIKAARAFLLQIKSALMQNAHGPLSAAETILRNRLSDALDYKVKEVRDELAELFGKMSVAAPKATAPASQSNNLANILGKMSLGRR